MKKTPTERAIIYCAAMANITPEEADSLLLAAGFGKVNRRSYRINLKHEAKLFRRFPEILKECIYHPRPLGKYKDNT